MAAVGAQDFWQVCRSGKSPGSQLNYPTPTRPLPDSRPSSIIHVLVGFWHIVLTTACLSLMYFCNSKVYNCLFVLCTGQYLTSLTLKLMQKILGLSIH